MQKYFWPVVVILGLVFTFFVPPFQKLDEHIHYLKIESMLAGAFGCEKDGVISASSRGLVEQSGWLEVSKSSSQSWSIGFMAKMWNINYQNTPTSSELYGLKPCGLPGLGYVPQLVGSMLFSWTGKPLVEFYGMRLGGLVFFLICVFFALRRSPQEYRWIIQLYALIPMALHEVSKVTYDSVVLGLFAIIFAYSVELFISRKRMPTQNDFLILVACGVALGLVKNVYALTLVLPCIVLILWREKRTILNWFTLTAGGIITSTYLYLTTAGASRAAIINASGVVDSVAQMQYLLTHPYVVITAPLVNLFYNFRSYFGDFFGGLGYQGYQISYLILIPFVIYCVLVFVRHAQTKTTTSLSLNWLLFAFITFIVIGIEMSLYVFYTPVGALRAEGVQGRYYLPLFPFILLILQLITIAYKNSSNKKIYNIAVLIVFILGILASIFARYYL